VAYTIKKQQYDKLDHLANGVSESSVRMTNLLNNLLNWVYLNKTLKVEQVNVYNLVNDTKALYENVLFNKQLSFYNNIDTTLTLTIKKNVLEIIIRNWLDNILKYSNATQIIFNATVEKNNYKIIIENDSTIAPEHLMQINSQLNKHGQIKNETSIGLGLNLIANFSKEESWKVELESDNGKTKFSITIHS
jgi:signal transduction histidine kinase